MALVDGLSHLLVQVTDLDRSEAFYRDVFGFDPLGRNLVAEQGDNALLKSNSGHMILLVKVDQVQPFRPNSSSIHHAFYLTPEQHQRARERRAVATGQEVSDTRASFRANGQLSFDVFDPDGHRYQVQSVGPEASVIMKADIGDVVCGKVEDFAIGSVTHFQDAQFYLVRHQDGFLALSHWCTHMNGELRWRDKHWSFYCAFHKATFNRKGESTGHRPYPPLRLHPVTIGDDRSVVVNTSELVQRRNYDQAQLAMVAPCQAAAAQEG